MSSIDHHITGPQYWRSLEQLAESPQVLAQIEAEFPGYDPEGIRSMSRRRFMKLMAASMALAGIGLTGCRRWPKETLVPQTSNPEGRIPGLSEQYATVMELGGVGHGLLAISYEGRPIKLEGNPLHPMSRVSELYGSADVYAQASLLELYDPDRSRGLIRREGNEPKTATWADFRTAAGPLFGGDGAGVAVLSEAMSGPASADMRARFLRKFPAARWHEYEPMSHDNQREATRLAFGSVLRPRLHLDKADVVFSLDADLLGSSNPAHTRYANDWVARRRSADVAQSRSMSRVYVVESTYTITGAVADHRLPNRPSRMRHVISHLAVRLGVSGVQPVGELTSDEAAFVNSAAADLKAAANKAVVAAGAHLPPDVQAVALAINAALGSIGNTVTLLQVADADRPTHAAAIADLAKQIGAGSVKTLLILGGNPAYDAPADLDFAKLLGSVANTIHLSHFRNETSLASSWHLPRAHYLESWGDARAYDGTVSIQQPLIEPLFGGLSPIELLAMLSGDQVTAGRDIVLRANGGNEPAFRRTLHDGVVANSAFAPATVTIRAFPLEQAAADPQGAEIRFLADASVYDGRFANNGWLQELPDPLTKLTWDNAALINQADAAKLGVGNGDVVALSVGGRSLDVPVFILPGQPTGVIALPLGYGRGAAGSVGSGQGVDTYKLRAAGGAMAVAGADIKPTGRTYKLVATQEHHLIDEVGFEGRVSRVGEKHKSGIVIREGAFQEFAKNPRSVHPHGHGNLTLQLFDPPHVTKPAYDGAPVAFNEPHAWGMAIDMTACIGCNACVIACQAENNIPIVGKEQVAVNREMHWIRIDRYFKGSRLDPNPEVTFQPMTCVHCENAPCEQVCPVAATVHDTEGLNTMVYNRCIGTRYCSNNCPYKVRRFNYFDWHSKAETELQSRFPQPWPGPPDTQQREQVDPIRRMVFNPEVTVRMRGVMEKCTYCTQRLQQAKIKAKNDHLAGKRESDIVRDGEVLTACQQSCPTQAIVFGNLNDPKAGVVALHSNPRAYSVLEELNTRPRTKHLAKLRNPSPAIATSDGKASHDGDHSHGGGAGGGGGNAGGHGAATTQASEHG